jgi:hypothetical protein
MVTRGRRCRCAVLRDSRERAREWVASAPTRARSESEAQEDDTRLRKTSRVASPLVMARRRKEDCPDDFANPRFTATQATTPASQGVVPHETFVDPHVYRSGFAALRLRQGPMSSTPKRARAGT